MLTLRENCSYKELFQVLISPYLNWIRDFTEQLFCVTPTMGCFRKNLFLGDPLNIQRHHLTCSTAPVIPQRYLWSLLYSLFWITKTLSLWINFGNSLTQSCARKSFSKSFTWSTNSFTSSSFNSFSFCNSATIYKNNKNNYIDHFKVDKFKNSPANR